MIDGVPSQVLPSPVNPGRHTHSKLPGVLSHLALSWQSSIPKAHSSMSESGTKE